MIRIIWYYIVLFVSSVVHGLGSIGAAMLGVKSRPGGVYDWGTRDWARWVLWGAGTRVLVDGLDRIPRDTPVVYASNHSSMFDIWALSLVLPGSTRFVAKQELGKIPIVGPAMKRVGHIMIDRHAPAKAMEAYAEAAQRIRGGVSPIVFPEGTRSRDGRLLPFKNAPFGLAIAAQVPLVPVYVHDTFEILPKGAWRLRPKPIRVLIGAPIPTAGLAPADRMNLRDQAHAAIAAMRARVDAQTATP